MRRIHVLLSSLLATALATGALAACSSDDSAANGGDAGTTTDAAFDAAIGRDASNGEDAGGDAIADAAPGAPRVIASFDKSKGELPEGLWEVGPAAVGFVGAGGTPISAFAPTATVVTIGADGGATPFASLAATPLSTYTLGVTTDAAGAVYVAVAAAAAPPNDPAPGIYKVPAGGGAPTLFSAGSAATPPMAFANGLDFVGSDLFVADSEGVIYKVNASGVATAWSQDPLLAPSTSACGGKVPLPIGANGITHDANAVYVTNTDYGRLVKIPIAGDGSAGTPVVVKEDCATLVGADGLLIDPKDHSFVIALNVLNEVVRLSADGSALSVVASGGPLANPASPVLDTSGGVRRLLVSNPAFFTDPDAGAPNLVEIAYP